MEKTRERPKKVNFLLTAAALVIVMAGIRASASIVVPFLLAVFIAIICSAPLVWMERKRVPKALALLIILAVIIACMLALITIVGSSARDFSQALPQYEERLQKMTSDLQKWLNENGMAETATALLESFDPNFVMKFVGRMFSGLAGVLSNTFLIMLTLIFILLEASGFPAKLHAAFGKQTGNFEKFITKVNHYVAIKTVISFITGVLITVWLIILGVDYPLLWGLLAFLLNFVPNIGSIIAAVPAMLLALIQFGVGSALVVGLGYLVVNVVIGSLIEPRFMGKGLGLSTLVVFISLVFWGWMLGPVGMLLSIPLTVTVKIALESKDETRWIAILLGPKMEAVPEIEPAE